MVTVTISYRILDSYSESACAIQGLGLSSACAACGHVDSVDSVEGRTQVRNKADSRNTERPPSVTWHDVPNSSEHSRWSHDIQVSAFQVTKPTENSSLSLDYLWYCREVFAFIKSWEGYDLTNSSFITLSHNWKQMLYIWFCPATRLLQDYNNLHASSWGAHKDCNWLWGICDLPSSD